MAAIGTGWVDGAWVEAAWVTEAWSDEVAAAPADKASGGARTDVRVTRPLRVPKSIRPKKPEPAPEVAPEPAPIPDEPVPTFAELTAAARDLAEPGTPEFETLLEIARDLAPTSPEGQLTRQDIDDLVVVRLDEFRALQDRERAEQERVADGRRLLDVLEAQELEQAETETDLMQLLLLLAAANVR